MTIKITGEIAHEFMDNAWYEDEISSGKLTPASRVVKALEAATPEDPVDLMVDSYGGDVYGGGAMVNALRAARARGVVVTVHVGVRAFSMAANLIAAMKADGARVIAAKNTTIMFHSCYSYAGGGPQAHEDEAHGLRITNEAVIDDLNRCGITDCRAWFAEGRMHWISAKEALAMGLVSEIENSDAPIIAAVAARLPVKIAAMMQEHANMETPDNTPAETPAEQPTETVTAEQPTETPAEQPAETTAEEQQEAATETPAETPPEQSAEMVPLARFAGMQSALTKRINAVEQERDQLRASIANLTTDIAERNAALKTANAEIEQLRASHAETTKALDECQQAVANLEQRYREHVGLALTQPTSSGSAKSPRETLASLPPDQRAAYYDAHKDEIDNGR